MVVQTFFKHWVVLAEQRKFAKASKDNKEEGGSEDQEDTEFQKAYSTILLHYTRRNHLVKIEPVTNDDDRAHQLECGYLALRIPCHQ